MTQETVISLVSGHSIAILLPVYNGARFLAEQLASLDAQTYADWHVLASDDGSSDASRDILQAHFLANPDKLSLFDGPHRGASANVLSLLSRVGPAMELVAFCDQDDVWHPDKLARAASALSPIKEPALFCSRTALVDDEGRFLRLSPPRRRQPTFQNALVQNIASGNTMVLNRAGWQLLASQCTAAADVAYHDWWAYQLISGAGGQILHDDTASLDYRQHDSNLLGASVGVGGAVSRTHRAVSGSLASGVTRQLAALQRSKNVLTPENALTLDRLATSRSQSALSRLRAMVGTGVYRQARSETLGLWASAVLGRF